MSKMQRQLKQARKRGLSPLQLAQMQAIAKSNAIAMEEEATWQAFKLMLCLSINVLGGIYWQKTGKRKIPEFVENVIDLYEAINCNAVSWEDVEKAAEEYGYKFDSDKLIDIREEKRRNRTKTNK